MLDEQSILLSALPPTLAQRRLAAGVAIVLFVALLTTIPFMQVQLPAVQPFIPIVDTILFLNDLIKMIAVIMGKHAKIYRRQLFDLDRRIGEPFGG